MASTLTIQWDLIYLIHEDKSHPLHEMCEKLLFGGGGQHDQNGIEVIRVVTDSDNLIVAAVLGIFQEAASNDMFAELENWPAWLVLPESELDNTPPEFLADNYDGEMPATWRGWENNGSSLHETTDGRWVASLVGYPGSVISKLPAEGYTGIVPQHKVPEMIHST